MYFVILSTDYHEVFILKFMGNLSTLVIMKYVKLMLKIQGSCP